MCTLPQPCAHRFQIPLGREAIQPERHDYDLTIEEQRLIGRIVVFNLGGVVLVERFITAEIGNSEERVVSGDPVRAPPPYQQSASSDNLP